MSRYVTVPMRFFVYRHDRRSHRCERSVSDMPGCLWLIQEESSTDIMVLPNGGLPRKRGNSAAHGKTDAAEL